MDWQAAAPEYFEFKLH